MPDGETIQQMFADVAPRYDRANRLLSLGIDVLWRRRTVAIAALVAGERALDVCAGTGDLSLQLARAGARVVGTDFCAPMLVQAADKARRAGTARRHRATADAVAAAAAAATADGAAASHADGGTAADARFAVADALALPFGSGAFDLCTVAFGIRNVEDPIAALREMARVTRPGGRVVVLEFCRPRVPVLSGLYLFYFRRVLPRLGRLISGTASDAYQYLPDSVMTFPERQAFLDLMQRAGLQRPTQTILSGGIAAVYRGEVSGNSKISAMAGAGESSGRVIR